MASLLAAHLFDIVNVVQYIERMFRFLQGTCGLVILVFNCGDTAFGVPIER